MSTKAKIKIFTGIAVLLAIVVAAVAYCGRERQIPTDIGCFPHIKRICVGGEGDENVLPYIRFGLQQNSPSKEGFFFNFPHRQN